MKLLTILFAAFVLVSLGFTMIDKKINVPDRVESKQEFKISNFSMSPYNQSRKDIATYD